MIRTSAKVTGLAALAMLGTAVGVNCSKSDKSGGDTTGSVKLALSVPPGVTVNSVSYIIHEGAPVAPDSAIADVTGSINTTDPNSSASVDHSFPRSTGDTVTMDADTVADATHPSVHCHGVSPMFDLAAGGTAMVGVQIICPNGANIPANQNSGSVIVMGTFVSNGDHCPLLTSWIASPLSASAPGGTVSVMSTASDADGDTLTYAWTSAPGGSFAAPGSSNTTFSCGAVAAGTTEAETLTLTVNDGHGCTASIGIPVSCVGVPVVSGTAGTTGAAGAAGTTGAAGAAGTTGAAGAAGTTGAAGAAGTTGAAGAAGTTGAAGAAGTTGMAGGGGTSPLACEISGTNSGVCYNTSAFGTSGMPASAFGCNSFTAAADITACNDLANCLRGTMCNAQILAAHNNGTTDYPFLDDGTPCLCGSVVAKSACLATTTWAGVCQAQYAAAAHGAAGVATGFFDTTLPIGVGNNLFTCDVDNMCIPPTGTP